MPTPEEKATAKSMNQYLTPYALLRLRQMLQGAPEEQFHLTVPPTNPDEMLQQGILNRDSMLKLISLLQGPFPPRG